MEEANADGRMPGKLRKRDILRSYCGRFIVSLISTEDVEQLHNVLPSYYAMDSTQSHSWTLSIVKSAHKAVIIVANLAESK